MSWGLGGSRDSGDLEMEGVRGRWGLEVGWAKGMVRI